MKASKFSDLCWISLYLCYLTSLGKAVNDPFSDETYIRYEILDEKCELYWTFNNTHIIFKMQAKTNGFILFGISLNGSMQQYDAIIGGVNHGKQYFTNINLIKNQEFDVESIHDWSLVNASESENETTLIFSRSLDTGDPDNATITNKRTRVIFDYQLYDAVDEHRFNYSSVRTKDVALFSTDHTLNEEVDMFHFLIDKFQVPKSDLHLECKIFNLPQLHQKHHLIRFEPVIQVGHEHIVHHILLYTCDSSLNKPLIKTSFNCIEDSPIDILYCESSFVLWAMNGPAYDYPPNVGYPLGGPKGSNVFIMEVHYKSDGRKEYMDNSGLRIFLTKQLRQYDAGQLGISIDSDRNFIIPPYEEKFVSSGYCHEECIKKALGDQEIRVFAGFLHSHSLGRKIGALHIRNGTELTPLFFDNSFNSSQQILFKFREEVVIKKGDTLMVRCEYNSSEKSTVTLGGVEMCSLHIFYYPQVNIHHCSSSLKYKNDGLSAIVESFNWTDPQVKKKFNKEIEEAKLLSSCTLSDGETRIVGPVPRYP